MKVEFTRNAALQLAAILDYIDQHNPAAATKIAARVDVAVRVIGEHPEIGRRQEQHGVWKYVVQPGGYLLFYRIDREADWIRIFLVTHPAKKRFYNDL